MSLLSWLFGKRPKNKILTRLTDAGVCSLNVVGESYYQTELECIAGGYAERSQRIMVNAVLVPENNNQYDQDAVKIVISGKTVGHLSRADAKQYRAVLKEINCPNATLKCPAWIVGGWDDGQNDSGFFGVKLDLQLYEESKRSDDEKAPNQTEFTFEIDRPNIQELPNAVVGENVTLWAPDEDPTKIRIYRRRSCGGSGRLGYVPQKYARQISKHRSLQLPIETEILEITSSACSIRCRLISHEEAKEKAKREKDCIQEKLRAELTKPYRSQKPIEF